jgi:acetolactate synthase-1/2/3 large subunit
MGTFGTVAANAVVGAADVVLAVGTKLAPIDTADESASLLDPTRQILLQIDVEPLNVSWTYPIDHPLVGDAGFVMDELARRLRTDAPARGERAVDWVTSAEASDGELGAAAFTSDEVPLAPQRIVRLLQETFPENGIITCDAGENRLFMMHWYRPKSANSYLQPAAGGGMGYAVPAALGAKLACPDRPVLAVCGDGGFAMSIHALMTAVQADIPITVVVFNNNALGWVLHGMGEHAVAAAFDEFDHAAIARSLGCDGVRIDSTDALRVALASVGRRSKPFVIDVPTSLTTSFRDIVQSLAGDRWKRGE